MKIAIICDWLVTIGGAEKVLVDMLACFPDADLFAVVDFLSDHERALLQGKKAKTTFIQKLPFAKSQYRRYLPLMPLAIEQLDLSAYTLILSSSHAVAKGVITGPDQLHVSYVHTPMRYAWDLQHQYLRETGLDKKWSGWLARFFLHKLRPWDLRSAVNVDHFLTNSHFVARRIQKTYRRTAEVLPPPVDTERFAPYYDERSDTYLTVSRFVPYKKIDLIVDCFNALPDKKLIIIGDGPDFAKIKAKAGNNITLLGYQPDAVLIYHMQRAKAFLFAAEEDFGIVLLEAQACGTPVIAFGKGGATETIVDVTSPLPTGLLYTEQTPAALTHAIATFEKNLNLFAPEHGVHHAAKYSRAAFRAGLRAYIEQKVRSST